MFNLLEANHHVRHLHASVVNVVLHIDVASGLTQKTNESVAKNGISQMTDMRCFVGIDAGMFNQHFILALDSYWTLNEHLPNKLTTIQERVDVACSGNLKLLKAWNR